MIWEVRGHGKGLGMEVRLHTAASKIRPAVWLEWEFAEETCSQDYVDIERPSLGKVLEYCLWKCIEA